MGDLVFTGNNNMLVVKNEASLRCIVIIKKQSTREELRLHTLHSLLSNLKEEFACFKKGDERGMWLVYSLLAIILLFTSSKTSGLVRAFESVCGFTGIRQRRYYTFMSSAKIIEIYGVRWKFEAGFKELK